MYQLSRLKKPSMTFISSRVATGASQSIGFAIAVAYVLSRPCPLPSMETEELEMFYRNTCLGFIQKNLGTLNEFCPVNIELVKAVAFGFYKQRYSSNFPAERPICVRAEMGICDFFGLNISFSKEVLDEINNNPDLLMTNISMLTDVFNELGSNKFGSLTDGNGEDVNFAP